MNSKKKSTPARDAFKPLDRRVGSAQQFKPAVAQLKAPVSVQSSKPPVAPPVYRPQPLPRVLQAKMMVQPKTVSQARTLIPSPSGFGPTPYRNMGLIVQRAEDPDWEPGSSSDMETVDDESSADQEIPLTSPAQIANWQTGAALGFAQGWRIGIESERVQLPQQPTLDAAVAMVGPPNALWIADAQAVPPGTKVLPGQEQDDGFSRGWNHGVQAGANEAFRKLAWARKNYPAIPSAAQPTAKLQNGGKCVYCNVAWSTTVDHVYPIEKHWSTLGYQGAPLSQVNDASNLVGCCGPCNSSKSNTYLNLWNHSSWGFGQWFPHGPGAATIPPKRGNVIAWGNW